MRVRFAPSPTGYLHIGSARTFIFNWLYARHHGGTVILRIDDTDIERNTDQSLNSIFDGLNWLELGWDELYRQSERVDLHRRLAQEIFEKGHAYRDFTPARPDDEDASYAEGSWLFNAGMRELSREESHRRSAAGEPFVLRFLVPRDGERSVQFQDLVFGTQTKQTADIEDFALLRSNGMPTYHMASCADDVDLEITHIIRGQDHLSNTFKHILIFEALGKTPAEFAHLPLLTAPDGAKLSKRKHGPVVSVTTYRDAGFLPHAYVNFLCLLGWSPKDNREQMTLAELIEAFKFENVNRSNAVVNFSDEGPIDPKALWLNGQHLRAAPAELVAKYAREVLLSHGFEIAQTEAEFVQTIDIVRSRLTTLLDFATKARPYFSDEFETQPESAAKLDVDGARGLMHELSARLQNLDSWTETTIEQETRQLAKDQNVKAGILINGARAALTGQTVGPGAFALFIAVGRERSLYRLRNA